MFKLIRRISGSVIPRQDRPWAEDATSNAPHKRKRRRSWDDPEQAQRDKAAGKRSRAPGLSPEVESPVIDQFPITPVIEGEEVKDVTKGVKGVALEDKLDASQPLSAAPEPCTVPLPADDDQEELQDNSASTPTQAEGPNATVEEPATDDKTSNTESEPGPNPSTASEAATTTLAVEVIDEHKPDEPLSNVDDKKTVALSNQSTTLPTEVSEPEVKQVDIESNGEEKESKDDH